jgi:hypothetical protein
MERRKFLKLFSGNVVALYAVYFYLKDGKTGSQLTIKEISKLGYSIGCAYAISGDVLFKEIMKNRYVDAGFDTILLGRHFLDKHEFIFVQSFLSNKGRAHDSKSK